MNPIDLIVDLFKKDEVDPHRRETILDKRVAETKGQILLNLSDYTRDAAQLPRIENIIDALIEKVDEFKLETKIAGKMLKTGSENLYYAIAVGNKRGELFVEIPIKLINNLPVFTFTKNASFILMYENYVTKSKKHVGVL